MTVRDTLIGAGLLAVLVCTLFLPRLDVYPWAAPDEVHHLTVAKNIAVHGAYASGHPDRGLDYFDTYDSVGGPVLLPVAGAFTVFGAGLGVARGVMVLFFLTSAGGVCVLRGAGHGETWRAAAGDTALRVLFFGLSGARSTARCPR